MVIWRSLSPSILAHVLALAATRLARVPGPPEPQPDRHLRSVGEPITAIDPNKVSRAQSAAGE